MIIEREFTIFENDDTWWKRKRLQLLEANDFGRTLFTKEDG
jgi:hypothetical protein